MVDEATEEPVCGTCYTDMSCGFGSGDEPPEEPAIPIEHIDDGDGVVTEPETPTSPTSPATKKTKTKKSLGLRRTKTMSRTMSSRARSSTKTKAPTKKKAKPKSPSAAAAAAAAEDPAPSEDPARSPDRKLLDHTMSTAHLLFHHTVSTARLLHDKTKATALELHGKTAEAARTAHGAALKVKAKLRKEEDDDDDELRIGVDGEKKENLGYNHEDCPVKRASHHGLNIVAKTTSSVGDAVVHDVQSLVLRTEEDEVSTTEADRYGLTAAQVKLQLKNATGRTIPIDDVRVMMHNVGANAYGRVSQEECDGIVAKQKDKQGFSLSKWFVPPSVRRQAKALTQARTVPREFYKPGGVNANVSTLRKPLPEPLGVEWGSLADADLPPSDFEARLKHMTDSVLVYPTALRGDTILMYLAQAGDLHRLRAVMDRASVRHVVSKVNFYGHAALDYAVGGGHEDIVELLGTYHREHLAAHNMYTSTLRTNSSRGFHDSTGRRSRN